MGKTNKEICEKIIINWGKGGKLTKTKVNIIKQATLYISRFF
jgi:hypothetical protein